MLLPRAGLPTSCSRRAVFATRGPSKTVPVPTPRRLEDCCMSVFRAYYDASGADGAQGHLVVVGLAATEKKWSKFEKLWQGVLTDFGVTYFHMKEFAHSRCEYKTWKGANERRNRFVAALLKAIKLGVNKGYFTGVANETMTLVNNQYDMGVETGVYTLTANVCRRRIEHFVQRKHRGSAIHHVFEKGDKGQGNLRRLMELNPHSAAGFSFVPKMLPDGSRLRSFEAADLIAYEGKRLLDDRVAGWPRPLRKSALEIGRTLPMYGTIIEKEQMLKICEEAPPDIIARRV